MSVKRKDLPSVASDSLGPIKRRKQDDVSDVVMDEQTADMEFEAEYSRLIHAVGKDTLLRMQQYRILLCGMGGLGVEIAKNLVLTGVKSLTLRDPTPVQIADLSSNFQLTEEDVGKLRDVCCLGKLREMNERVDLQVYEGEIVEETLKQFNIVVMTENTSKTLLEKVNAFCRSNNIGFIASDCRGLFSASFVDFGEKFVSNDVNGERNIDRHLEYIANGPNPIVNVLSSGGEKHDLDDGDVVTFSEVEGMTEINGLSGKITVINPFSFKIDIDTTNFKEYTDRGRIIQVKQPKIFKHSPLIDTWKSYNPEGAHTMDFMKDLTIQPTLHVFYQALLIFQERHGGALPRPYSNADSSTLISIAKEVNANSDVKVDELDEKLLTKLSYTAAGNLSPMACVVGGIIAQEVMKHAGQKFTPLNQWLYFDSLECLGNTTITEADAAPQGTRYDGQIAVFGKKYCDRIRSLRYFLVGSGAIGCEILKNWAMMGVGSAENGHIYVTDMDTIEVSNLNRQFLYRSWDVGHFKSKTAAAAVTKMNPDIKTEAYTVKAASETENVFNDSFWNSLDGVQNALDNVNARMYIDGRCVFFQKSLIEPGTSGAKGNVQVVVPFLTESYSSTPDPPQKENPICLIHSFPNNIQHCLQWARELLFEGYFSNDPDVTNQFLKNDNYLETVSPNLMKKVLETLDKTILQRPKTFDDCIVWARQTFEKHFYETVVQLLFSFPLDYADDKGHRFWSGAKRPPTPVHYDRNNSAHVDFVVAAAFLRAYTFGLLKEEFKPADLIGRRAEIAEKAQDVHVPEFKPRSGVKFETDPEAKNPQAAETADDDDDLVSELKKKVTSAATKLDKDSYQVHR